MSNQHPMNCQEARPLLSEYIDAALDEDSALALKGHLNFCGVCNTQHEGLKGVGRLLKGLPLKPLPAGFMARLSSRRGAVSPSYLSAAPRVLGYAFAVLLVGVVVYRTALPQPRLGRAAVATDLAEVAQAPQPRTRPAPFRDTGAPLEKSAAPPETPLLPAPPSASLAGEGSPAYAPQRGESFDNAAQARKMKKESADLGIQNINPQDEPASPEPFLGRRMGSPEVAANAERNLQQLIAMRHAIEESTGKPKPAAIAGQTAPLLSRNLETNGAAIADEQAAVPAPAGGQWQGAYSGGNEGTRTITDVKTWRELWRTLAPGIRVPNVDFSRQEVVAVFLGERATGGFAVEISEVSSNETAVTVKWREKIPPAGLPAPEGVSTPYAMRAVPRSDLPVRFEKIP